MLGSELNRQIFTRAAADADVSIIEGMMGLFDGSSSVSEWGSTAELAKQLEAPVLLVIDGSAMARSAAAMAFGYARFDPTLRVVGVLFNRLSGEKHYCLLKEAVEKETDLQVVGYLHADASLTMVDRHLGLQTAIEQGATDLYERLGSIALQTVDLEKIETLASSAGEIAVHPCLSSRDTDWEKVRVGVAYDPAFCFYYQENLELLEVEGAELVRFSPIHDRHLPEVDLLYLGGGYPEMYARELADNEAMREAVRRFADEDGPIYAECGGLMYLTAGIRDFEDRLYPMVGLYPATARMRRSGLTLGYREVQFTTTCALGEPGMRLRGHEFHYSVLEPAGPLEYGCRLTDARGIVRGQDGLLYRRVLALYTHVHFSAAPQLPRRLVAAAQAFRCRERKAGA